MAIENAQRHLHLKRASARAQRLDLEQRVLRALAEALKARFGSTFAQQLQHQQRIQLQQVRHPLQLFDELSVNWPKALRDYLLENWQAFADVQQQQQQQQQEQQQQQQQQQQEEEEEEEELRSHRQRRHEHGHQRQQQQEQQQQPQQRQQPRQLQRQEPQAPRESESELARIALERILNRELELSRMLVQANDDVEALAADVESKSEPVRQSDQPAVLEEHLQFSLWSPHAVAVGQTFVLDFWVHTASQATKVQALMNRMGQSAVGKPCDSVTSRAAALTVRLLCPALVIEQDLQLLTWTGTENSASFTCRADSGSWGGTVQGYFDVRAGGLSLSRLPFELKLTAGPQLQQQQQVPWQQQQQQQQQFQKMSWTSFARGTAFASYSSEDRIDVLRCTEGLKKGAPFMDVYLDIVKLRSGDDWERTLMAYIRTSDVFYLFWSPSAAKSNWVDREWRYAYQERGLDFIDPFPLEDPRLVPPPTELERLHFNSAYLSHINAEKYIKERMRAIPQTGH
ncbi:toll/interleukin-1 receptor domain-containing protein [Aquincola sp. S2]|uniref:Toll/interleukin-1 receptor domain-containing protein n=1 Tax=Pseudaquabacterium terrae TaxID=2732868 RepID=A0ABX2EU80_9BURK|nr:toll/interleukin-1 receptor domain-containing protein [Aquabacterium terrae]NRF72300.1 toll/interleukin-1 receptor domain-containing protein [Aquabacterium terrae]